MVSGSADGTARIWNATNGQSVTIPLRHDGAVHWAEFSPDGRRLVTATADQSARIWNTDEGRLKHTLANHDSKVFRAHFSPDGERIATITERGSIGLWEAESGKLRFELNEHGTRVNAFAFSPDGRRFVAADSHGTAWVWSSADAPKTVIAIEGGRLAGNYLGVDNVSVVADDSTPSPAPANLVVNGSFETFTCPVSFAPDGSGVMSLPPGSTAIPGWTTTTHELAWVMNVNSFGPRTLYGSLFLDLTGYHDASPYGGLTQTLATTPGQTYRLSFAIGAHGGTSSYREPMTVAVTVGSVSNSFTFTPTGTGNQWGAFTMNFTAKSAFTPLTFIGTASAGGAFLGLDNVSVTASTAPETIHIASVALTGGDLRIAFVSTAGAGYLLESRDDLGTGAWIPVAGSERTGNGEELIFSLPVDPAIPHRFYRLRESR